MKVHVAWAILGLMLLLPLTSSAAPLQLRVSTQGDDTASGTTDAPLASLAGARDRLRNLRSKPGLPDGAVVTLEAGTYPVQQAILFSPEDSGTNKGPILFQAAPNAQVIISGGKTISGWRQQGDFWVTTVPEVKEGHLVVQQSLGQQPTPPTCKNSQSSPSLGRRPPRKRFLQGSKPRNDRASTNGQNGKKQHAVSLPEKATFKIGTVSKTPSLSPITLGPPH